jgi:hypothetical protein
MAERMAAQIWIGGRLSANLAAELRGAINTEYVSLEFGDGQFCPDNLKDLLRASVDHDDSRVLRLCDDQASWGEFADLESFLQEHSIPYTRQGEGGGSYNGEIVEYRPGTDPVCTPVDANGNPTVDVDAIRRVAKSLDTALEQLNADAVRKAALWLKRARRSLRKQLPPEIPPLPSFEIEGYQQPEENHGQ